MAADPIRVPAVSVQPPVLGDQRAVVTVGGRGLSVAQLEALGLHRVATSTFWPEDDGVYEGPLLSDVLALAGIGEAKAISVVALDDFSQIIPREDWTRWPTILATRHDGKPMGTRDKGPTRIIYPRDSAPELHDVVYRLRWVWMVRSIDPVAR